MIDFIPRKDQIVKTVFGIVGVFLVAVGGSARAQEEWQADAGFNALFNTGNSSSQTFGGTGLVSHKEGKHKIGWTGKGAYGRAEDPATGISTTNTKNWETDLRYDRYITDPISLFALTHIGADEPAGFDLTYGGAGGVADELFRTDPNYFKYELGFDYTRQNQTDFNDQNIYSARVYFLYKYTFSKVSFFSQDMENLFNLRQKDDVRINTMTALTFKITEVVGFKAGYNIRFDNFPVPGKKKTDTQTTLGIVVDLL